MSKGGKTITDPVTGNFLYTIEPRKRDDSRRNYLAMQSLNSAPRLMSVQTHTPIQQTSVQQTTQHVHYGNVPSQPLPGNTYNPNVPSNLSNYTAQPYSEDHSSLQGQDSDIGNAILNLMYQLSNSTHLAAAAMVFTRDTAKTAAGENVDAILAVQRPDSGEMLTSRLDLNIDANRRYEEMDACMKRIQETLTPISGVSPTTVSMDENGTMSPYTQEGLSKVYAPVDGYKMLQGVLNKTPTGSVSSSGRRYRIIPYVLK